MKKGMVLLVLVCIAIPARARQELPAPKKLYIAAECDMPEQGVRLAKAWYGNLNANSREQLRTGLTSMSATARHFECDMVEDATRVWQTDEKVLFQATKGYKGAIMLSVRAMQYPSRYGVGIEVDLQTLHSFIEMLERKAAERGA